MLVVHTRYEQPPCDAGCGPQYGCEPQGKPLVRPKPRTVFDILDTTGCGTSVIQVMPPVLHEIRLNGQPYTVIAIEGLPPSAHLTDAIEFAGTSGGAVADFAIDCPNADVDTDRVFLDAYFLLLAYSMTDIARLDFNALMCLVDDASLHRLPLDYEEWLRRAICATYSPESLRVLIDTVSTFSHHFFPPQEGDRMQEARVACLQSSLAGAAVEALRKSGDRPENFVRVSYALLLSLHPADFVGARDWYAGLMEEFGKAYASASVGLPIYLTGSHFVLMANDVIDSVVSNRDGGRGRRVVEDIDYLLPRGEDAAAYLQEPQTADLELTSIAGDVDGTYRRRVAIFYDDIHRAMSQWTASRLQDVLTRWFREKRVGSDVTIQGYPASEGSSCPIPRTCYRNLRYAPCPSTNSPGFVSDTTGSQWLAPSRVFGAGDWEKVTVSLTRDDVVVGGLNPAVPGVCCSADVPARIRWPFGQVVPLDATSCSFVLDAPALARRALCDLTFRESLQFL